MSKLYIFEKRTYCGEDYGPPVTRGDDSTGTFTFSSTCGYAIVDGKCNSKWEHEHPGVPNTWKSP